MSKVYIYLDGSCSGTGNDTEHAQAGWAYVMIDPAGDETTRKGKVSGRQTVNRAEISALMEAMSCLGDFLGKIGHVVFYSDSELLIDGVLGKSKRKANRDIWIEVEKLFVELREHMVFEIQHVSREENKADKPAKEAAHSLIIPIA